MGFLAEFENARKDGITLIHDFNWDMRCSDSSKMRIPELAAEMALIKNNEEEIVNMCKEFDITFLSGINEQVEITVLEMFEDGERDMTKYLKYTHATEDAINEILKKHNLSLPKYPQISPTNKETV